jgi:hypothetical protein
MQRKLALALTKVDAGRSYTTTWGSLRSSTFKLMRRAFGVAIMNGQRGGFINISDMFLVTGGKGGVFEVYAFAYCAYHSITSSLPTPPPQPLSSSSTYVQRPSRSLLRFEW